MILRIQLDADIGRPSDFAAMSDEPEPAKWSSTVSPYCEKAPNFRPVKVVTYGAISCVISIRNCRRRQEAQTNKKKRDELFIHNGSLLSLIVGIVCHNFRIWDSVSMMKIRNGGPP